MNTLDTNWEKYRDIPDKNLTIYRRPILDGDKSWTEDWDYIAIDDKGESVQVVVIGSEA